MDGPIRVLIVEDNENDVKLLLRELRRGGFEPVYQQVYSAEAMTAALNDAPWDIITCDYFMPTFNGMEALMLARERRPDLPIIVVSGQLGEEIAVDMMKNGANDYITKDNLARLVPAVQRGLADAEVRRGRQESDELFKTLAENSPIGIFLYRDKFIYVNPMMTHITGYTQEELLTISLSQLIPEFKEEYEATLNRRMAGHVFSCTYHDLKIVTNAGAERWLDVHANTISFLGQPTGVGSAIDVTERKILQHKLELLATTDKLTRILNRRKLDELLAGEIARSTRYRTPLSLMIFDLDHFKEVNDTYGHQAGDAVLQMITAIVGKNIRKVDYFGRWGGEEFMLILPETSVEKAGALAEKLRELIAGHSLDQVGRITVSFGVSQLKGGDTVGSLIKRADDALYRAKATGRNRMVCG
ncbi:MAG: diguanylate cyclase [Deltaproteobacteria bacterium]|nr:diguanylate cyclase [Deltaproteobacteria bacterium]